MGRDPERESFRSALEAPEPSFVVLYVYGPGGIGKTSLLHEFSTIVGVLNYTALYVDCRNLEPLPDPFVAALSSAAGVSPADTLVEHFAQFPKFVLLLDTFETLAPLEDWLR